MVRGVAVGVLVLGVAVAQGSEYVIDVPSGSTVTLDAAQITAEVTNIRKTGPGDLIAVALPDYAGDFTVDGGRFILNQHGDLGKDNVGTCYVNDGGTLCYSKNDQIARGETFVFAGQPASGYTYKFGRIRFPSDYKETWSYFSDAASKYRATDAAVVFATEGNRLQMQGSYDANGQDFAFDQRYASAWTTVQFNCALKITNARDIIIGYVHEIGSETVESTVGFELMTESGRLSLGSGNGDSHLIIRSNSRHNHGRLSHTRAVTTDGNWTLVLANAEWRVAQPPNGASVTTHVWNGRLCKEGPLARVVFQDGFRCVRDAAGRQFYPRPFYVSVRGPVEEVLAKWYACTFKDADGAVVRTQAGIVRNGSGVPPYVDTDAEELAGWRIDGTSYTRDEVLSLPLTKDTEAQAVMAPRKHTVRFLDSDGVTVLQASEVAHGADAVPPKPSKSGFAFVKWDRSYAHVTDDLSVKAVWRSTAMPTTYKDVTTYSSSGFLNRFSSLVADNVDKATDNATNLKKMISAAGSGGVLYFPKGTYYIGSRIDIGTANVTLWGAPGAELVRTGVSNENSTAYANNAESGSDYNWASLMMVSKGGLTIRGLTLRYAVPTCFTAEILTVKSDGSQTARLVDGRDADFNGNLRFQRINSFDAAGRPLGLDLVYGAGTTAGTHYRQASQIQTAADGRKTFTLSLGKDKVKAGDRVGLCCSTAYSQGIILYGGTGTISDITFEDVTVANCFSMTMVVKGVKNLTLRRFRVEDDTPGAIYATGMDGIHIAGLSGRLTMEECELRGLADDMLNVHATAGVVGSVSGTTVTLGASVESGAFVKGDTVKFYTAKLADLGTAKVTAAGTTSITVDALPDGVAAGGLIGNETKMPEVEISGCRFGVTRARGILLQTDAKIVVKNSEFHDTRLAGMLLSPSATGQWTEMGPIRDALVTNCTFTACGVAEASTDGKNNASVVIRCNHDSDSGWSFDKAANRNIRIVGNTFKDGVSAGVFAANTTGLTVNGNTFRACGGRTTYDSKIVRVEYCDSVTVNRNVSYGPGFVGSTASASSSNVSYADNDIWFTIRYLDADGTVLEQTLARCYGAEKLTPPAWSSKLTGSDSVFKAWVKSGETAPYDFTKNVGGPFDLQATYAPRP